MALYLQKKKNYQSADPDKFVEKIQDCVGSRYATAPDYVQTVKKLFRMVEKEIVWHFQAFYKERNSSYILIVMFVIVPLYL